ncbi:MAG: ABC transporter permease [Acidobacteriota bacterium]
MKFLRLILKNLLRNKRRTFLTVSSIAISMFLIATLETILTELNNPPETPDSALRLVVRHRISLFNALPAAYRQKIAQIEGVEAVIGSMWFGAIYKDPSNFFASFVVDADQFFDVYPDLKISEEEKEAFIRDRTGALVGSQLARRFGWKIGDKLFLDSNTWPISIEVTIRGIYEGGADEGSTLYLHWDYYNELLKAQYGQWDNTGTFMVRVKSPELVPVVAEQIDQMFRNSTAPTKTETEKAFLLSFVSMLGDVQLLITSIVSVVIFAVVLVAANTMAMSIRERTREIGVLKALGFRRTQVLWLLVGESLVLAMTGVALGAFTARGLFSSLDMATITAGFLSSFDVTNGTILFCLGIGVLIGAAASIVPAWQAARRPTVEALRSVV